MTQMLETNLLTNKTQGLYKNMVDILANEQDSENALEKTLQAMNERKHPHSEELLCFAEQQSNHEQGYESHTPIAGMALTPLLAAATVWAGLTQYTKPRRNQNTPITDNQIRLAPYFSEEEEKQLEQTSPFDSVELYAKKK